MRSPRVLAVDIGAGHVACGVFTAGAAGRLVLQQFALETHPSDPSHEARWGTDIAQSLGAVAGIVTYAALNPDQKIFNVPDVVKPPYDEAAAAYREAARLSPEYAAFHVSLGEALRRVAERCEPPQLYRFGELREKAVEVVQNLLRRAFLPTAAKTTHVVEGRGLEAAAKVFADLATGKTRPDDGHVIRLERE